MYQSLRIIRKQRIFGQIHRCYGVVREQTYYEILGIPKDASKQDIRLAFIKISKKKHPDKSDKDSEKSHADFVKITEAYDILSKDYLRQQYDARLKYGISHNDSSGYSQKSSSFYGTGSEHMYDTWYNVTMHERGEQFKRHRTAQNPIKLTKFHLVLFCTLVSLIGTSLQIWALLRSPVFKRQELLDNSMKLGDEYEKVRMRAIMNNKSNQDNVGIFLKITNENKDSEKENNNKEV